MLGDGECFEGAVWEAAQFANHHQLTNLIAIIDRNLEITLDYTEDCNALEPFAEKWIAYGWNVISINGHDFSEIFHGFQAAKENDSFKPSVIIASTVKRQRKEYHLWKKILAGTTRFLVMINTKKP